MKKGSRFVLFNVFGFITQSVRASKTIWLSALAPLIMGSGLFSMIFTVIFLTTTIPQTMDIYRRRLLNKIIPRSEIIRFRKDHGKDINKLNQLIKDLENKDLTDDFIKKVKNSIIYYTSLLQSTDNIFREIIYEQSANVGKIMFTEKKFKRKPEEYKRILKLMNDESIFSERFIKEFDLNYNDFGYFKNVIERFSFNRLLSLFKKKNKEFINKTKDDELILPWSDYLKVKNQIAKTSLIFHFLSKEDNKKAIIEKFNELNSDAEFYYQGFNLKDLYDDLSNALSNSITDSELQDKSVQELVKEIDLSDYPITREYYEFLELLNILREMTLLSVSKKSLDINSEKIKLRIKHNADYRLSRMFKYGILYAKESLSLKELFRGIVKSYRLKEFEISLREALIWFKDKKVTDEELRKLINDGSAKRILTILGGLLQNLLSIINYYQKVEFKKKPLITILEIPIKIKTKSIKTKEKELKDFKQKNKEFTKKLADQLKDLTTLLMNPTKVKKMSIK